MTESPTTKYSGSKVLDFCMAAMCATFAVLVWVPDALSVGCLKEAAFMFYIIVLFMAVKCLFNGGRL